MAKHGEDREDRAPRVAASPGKPMLGGKIGWTRREEDNRSDGTMARTILEISEPMSNSGHRAYCGAKYSLGCTSLPPERFLLTKQLCFTHTINK